MYRPGALSAPMVPDMAGASQILEKYQVENCISRLYLLLSYARSQGALFMGHLLHNVDCVLGFSIIDFVL